MSKNELVREWIIGGFFYQVMQCEIYELLYLYGNHIKWVMKNGKKPNYGKTSQEFCVLNAPSPAPV